MCAGHVNPACVPRHVDRAERMTTLQTKCHGEKVNDYGGFGTSSGSEWYRKMPEVGQNAWHTLCYLEVVLYLGHTQWYYEGSGEPPSGDRPPR